MSQFLTCISRREEREDLLEELWVSMHRCDPLQRKTYIPAILHSWNIQTSVGPVIYRCCCVFISCISYQNYCCSTCIPWWHFTLILPLLLHFATLSNQIQVNKKVVMITVMLIRWLNTEVGYDKAVDRQWSCATPSYSTDLRSKERMWGKESRMYKLRNERKGLYNQTLLDCTQCSVGGHVCISSYCNWIRQSDCCRTREKVL